MRAGYPFRLAVLFAAPATKSADPYRVRRGRSRKSVDGTDLTWTTATGGRVSISASDIPNVSALQAIGDRRSIRYFDPERKLEDWKLQTILQACRLASQITTPPRQSSSTGHLRSLDEVERVRVQRPDHQPELDLVFWLTNITPGTAAPTTVSTLAMSGALPVPGWNYEFHDPDDSAAHELPDRAHRRPAVSSPTGRRFRHHPPSASARSSSPSAVSRAVSRRPSASRRTSSSPGATRSGTRSRTRGRWTARPPEVREALPLDEYGTPFMPDPPLTRRFVRSVRERRRRRFEEISTPPQVLARPGRGVLARA